MNISKPISTASRLRATFTSSAAPERAGKPIHATLSLDPGLHRRLKLAAVALTGIGWTMLDMKRRRMDVTARHSTR